MIDMAVSQVWLVIAVVVGVAAVVTVIVLGRRRSATSPSPRPPAGVTTRFKASSVPSRSTEPRPAIVAMPTAAAAVETAPEPPPPNSADRLDTSVPVRLAATERVGPTELGQQLHRGERAVWVWASRNDQVFQRLPNPGLPDEQVFARFVRAGLDVERSLAARGMPISLCWPSDLRTSGDIVGTLAPRIDPRFLHRVDGVPKTRTLDWAAAETPDSPDLRTRLALLRLVAEFLQELHSHSLVHGGVSQQNFTFAHDDPVELCVHDFGSTRLLGDPPLINRPGPPPSFDGDRYGYAGLVGALLTAGADNSALGPIGGLADSQTRRLVRLARRALGSTGSRPQIGEWLEVLSR